LLEDSPKFSMTAHSHWLWNSIWKTFYLLRRAFPNQAI
jgi:hypothetical protein